MKIKIGISSCLLGHEVRYDGGHKRSVLCTQTLSDIFEFVPVCPEVGIGLPIPRPTIHLVGDSSTAQAVMSSNHTINYTTNIEAYGRQKVLENSAWSGYIFMEQSPSCGLFTVKIYPQEKGSVIEHGRGLYAKVITDSQPLLPVEEARRLEDLQVRESFMTRVFAYSDWQQLQSEGITRPLLIDFHTRYKYSLMAHSPGQYLCLESLLENPKGVSWDGLAQQYFSGMMKSLQQLATPETHRAVCLEIQRSLKNSLTAGDNNKLTQLIDQYSKNKILLAELKTFLAHRLKNHPITTPAYFRCSI
ncbi:MAG TPA: DUF1722 domain-containing protein [Methylococcaceae bacterium]|jgi:uncharacterized protein YbbK (DUF523 family)/uncharacterized protein YbgA (DUF1722 family)|nr:DUF1722 domain-containing protein [Methylococcaceae bacterium]HIL40904.1 DUF1722 domain-containing protein [Methylococcales bacterium]